MLQALQRLPPLFAAGADPKAQQGQVSISVTCCLSDDGKQLSMNASSPAAFYSSLFPAAGLTKVKAAASAAMQWDEFFEQLEKAFTSKDIKFAYDSSNLVVSVPIAGGTAPFTLQKQSLSAIQGQALVLQQMCDAYSLRADKAAEDTTLAALQQKEGEWNAKIHALQQSKTQLSESIHAAEDEEAALRRQCNELQREYESLQRQRAAEGSDVGDDGDIAVEPDFTTCVGRIPLGERLHKDLDTELMKMVKSKFTPKKEGESDAEGDDKPAPYNALITPLSASEYAPYLSTFSASEKFVVMKCFDKIDAWDFDVFTIQDFTNKGSLFITAYALFLRYDFLRKFNLDEQVVVNFLSQIEAGYHPNPYHNSMHAADVLHILHYILSPGGLTKQAQLTEEDVFAALIAGMIHDYDHPGTNNNFHIKVQSYLATLYNDRSMLENHHCAEVWELMKNSNFNFVAPLSDEQRRDVRETVIDMVLSTDMGLHAKILGQWKRRIGQDMDLQKKEDQRLALAMAIKMADISNCGRPEALYLKWAHKIAEEFFSQGDRERNLGNAVSPFMDRSVPSMAKGQIAFMNYIVIPLFESISEYLPLMHFSVEHCEQNKSYWTANTDDIGT